MSPSDWFAAMGGVLVLGFLSFVFYLYCAKLHEGAIRERYGDNPTREQIDTYWGDVLKASVEDNLPRP
jgi:hypothetical protein